LLGASYGEEDIRTAIAASGFSNVRHLPEDRDLVDTVAGLLAEGLVIGWFQGRSEWGPRALGNRSILADPTRPDMQRIVNERIKFREPFRPFAPVVPVEVATDYFEMPPVTGPWCPEYFMLAVHPVRPKMRTRLPAITHADGSARVQVLSRESNPLFYDLVSAFGKLREIPILLNTSFNLRDEPVVETPANALRTFSYSDMDYLVLGNFVISKGITI
ncbi:MAG: carbamoyltransferase, partial [Proteobacteria bacterium]|nr:carbamoyltransferase [Pseudomonadota bacterium]